MMDSRRLARNARRRRARSLRVRAVLAGALVLGVGGSATLAAWTDQELASTTVTAGTFALSSRTSTSDAFVSHGPSETAATLSFSATGLYPGQIRAAWIQIQNTGTVPGTVSVTGVVAPTNGATGDALSGALKVRYVGTAPIANPNVAPTCTTSTTGGTEVTGLTTTPTGTSLSIAAGATVAYCLVLTLPTDATTNAQGGTATPTWTFTGTTG